ncbi:hypothetical protein F2Q70_00008356 [Brassica cretica]|uniref:Uncharacterized protein n=1 Tax=Brassica cretica TaxID=69181 RepID=A0A3N6RZZ5_BRACR|nr:hypothetical protein F2Q70_00008356 [Brassica cretica]KAF3548708.1 hypothetical protein DY000_02001844 [Brassica cretica]
MNACMGGFSNPPFSKPYKSVSHMTSKSKSIPHASNHRFQQSIEDRMAILVKRVGEVKGLNHETSLYWNSIDFLAKNDVSRGIFYALPDKSKLEYLERNIEGSNDLDNEYIGFDY